MTDRPSDRRAADAKDWPGCNYKSAKSVVSFHDICTYLYVLILFFSANRELGLAKKRGISLPDPFREKRHYGDSANEKRRYSYNSSMVLCYLKKKQEYMYVCMRKKCDFLYNPIYAFLGIFSSNFFHKARFLGQNRRLEYS